jgi:hypothetical protein
MFPKLSFLIIIGGLLTGCASVNKEAKVAPYPQGWNITAQSYVRGMYANAVLQGGIFRAIDSIKSSCQKNGQELVVKRTTAMEDVEHYWLYKTYSGSVLFILKLSVDTDQDGCTAVISESRSVERMKPADDWPFPFNAGSLRDEKLAKVTHPKIDGIQATCWLLGDLVGESECVSAKPGLSNGIAISQNQWSDDGSGDSSFKLSALYLGVKIPRELFDSGSLWATHPNQ